MQGPRRRAPRRITSITRRHSRTGVLPICCMSSRMRSRMNLSLSPEAQKMLEVRMKRGGYASPQDAVVAALASLDQQERPDAFAAGELDQLLAAADAEIE